MAIAAERIRPVGEKIIGDLRTKIGSKGSDKWQFRKQEKVETPSGNVVEKLVKYELTATDFLQALEAFLPIAMEKKNTLPFDNPLFKVFKPAFPHKDWLHASIDALDALNQAAVTANNGGEIPEDG